VVWIVNASVCGNKLLRIEKPSIRTRVEGVTGFSWGQGSA